MNPLKVSVATSVLSKLRKDITKNCIENSKLQSEETSANNSQGVFVCIISYCLKFNNFMI